MLMTNAPPTPHRPTASLAAAAPRVGPTPRAAAFDALVADAGEAVARYLYGMTGDPAAAEDLAQDVFTAAWQHLDTLRDPAAARSWLFAIAANAARRHLRRRSRFGWLPLEALALDAPRLVAGGRDDLPADGLALERALDELGVTDRAIVLLVGHHDLTIAEAAEAVGVTPGAAKKRWQRTCARLRAALSEEGER